MSSRSQHARSRRQLEALEDTCMHIPQPRAHPVVIDAYGAAWQFGGLCAPYWYRAYDGNGVPTHELAQFGPFKEIK